ncbi:MAG: hypothetical protein OXI07_09250 [Gammaproteobacteria bacterium]|nr:hypothetical protein [Gammaproteobacteria bacterium]
MTNKLDPLEDIDWEALSRYVQYSRRAYAKNRPGLFYDAPREFKGLEEEDVCERLAKSLAEQGECDIREIRKYRDPENPKTDLFPDCLAECDGRKIGMEVRELRGGPEAFELWPLEKFEESLQSIISEKNDKAQIGGREKFLATLHRLCVVIPTDEPNLPDETIRKYLQQIRLPKPSHIDKAYVLGPPKARDNPVIRGREFESMEGKPRCTAFKIHWIHK